MAIRIDQHEAGEAFAVKIEPHPMEKKETPNFALENVVAPRRVYDANKKRVLVTVAGFGTKKDIRNVTLVLNGRTIETKTVEVPESSRATVEFNSLDAPYGRNKGEVRIDSADSLPADDVYYFAVERLEPRHALFVHEADNTRGLLYFKTALEASGQSAFEIDPATVEQEYLDAKARYEAQVEAGLAWDERTGLATLRNDVDRRVAAARRYEKRLAHTKPATPPKGLRSRVRT